MRFRRIIKNAVPGKSTVQKFSVDDPATPIHTVNYAVPPLKGLTNYYMQFILGNFAFERYPAYIEGTKRSARVKDVFYYKNDEFIIRSSPYVEDEKWKFYSRAKKAVLPKRKKRQRLVARKENIENEQNRDTNGGDDKNNREVFTGKARGNTIRKLDRHKERVIATRKRICELSDKQRAGQIEQSVESDGRRKPDIKAPDKGVSRPRLKAK